MRRLTVTVVYLGILEYHRTRRKRALLWSRVTLREPYGTTTRRARHADRASRLRVSGNAGPRGRQVEPACHRHARTAAHPTRPVLGVEAKHSGYFATDVDRHAPEP